MNARVEFAKGANVAEGFECVNESVALVSSPRCLNVHGCRRSDDQKYKIIRYHVFERMADHAYFFDTKELTLLTTSAHP